MTIEKIVEIAEEIGFIVHQDERYIEFEYYTRPGEDFSFTVEVSEPEEIERQIINYYDNFDVDGHIEMWVEARGHVDGVPCARLIVQSTEEICDVLEEFWSKLICYKEVL